MVESLTGMVKIMQNTHLSYVCRSRFDDDTIAQAFVWPEHPLIGVSLYGHGCFLQCVEGDTTLVDKLLIQLTTLPQGFDAKIITCCSIEQISLTHSGTHYLLENVSARSLLQQHGMDTTHAIFLQEMLELFQTTHQITASICTDHLIYSN